MEEHDTDIIFPSASEIIFLLPENKYINQLLDIFMPNNYTHLLIKPEYYDDNNIIYELETQIKVKHQMSENIIEKIKTKNKNKIS